MGTTTDTSFPKTTAHAEIQLRRRGVRRQLLGLLVTEGDAERDVGGGCVARSCSAFALAEAARQGVSTDDIEQLRRLVAVIGADGTIVTVMNRPTWYARFQRGHAKLTARERTAMAERRNRGGACR